MASELSEFHWMMDVLQTIDVGLVVLDRDYHIAMWNSFMENHSGLAPSDVQGKCLFNLFDDISPEWFRSKTEAVFMLKNRAFITWEQRPFLFRFKNYYPITGTVDFMYQNITISPLLSAQGDVNQICLVIYDVTDTATHKIDLQAASALLEQARQVG
jgi:PAS domain-containing protein